jgi:pyruvate/2-oxoglutarate dehydrogenase complex dihydrolipoamide acyltransferase (E2) component
VTARGRVLVVLAFVVAAALCSTAAVALVLASRDDGSTTRALPTIHPTVLAPSTSPTASPAASAAPSAPASPTAAPSPSASPAASPTTAAAATASPAARRTRTTRPTATAPVPGLATDATINISKGGTTASTYVVSLHATDGNGTIYLRSVSWQAGETTTLMQRGAACRPAATAPADCRDYTVSHRYDTPGSYLVTLEVVSGSETSQIQFPVDVAAAPSPSPSAS